MSTQIPTTPKPADAVPFDIENLHQLMHSIRQLVAQVQQADYEGSLDDDAAAALNEALQRLNGEFRAWTGEANRRLRMCEAQFRANNRREAVRLAEMPPALLDLCGEIMSLGEDDRHFWDEFVAANRQPRPEPLLTAALEELNREYGESGSDVQQLLDELHVMVLARAPLSARLPVLWQLARRRTSYEQDVPAWERARLEQMDDEAKAAVALAEPQAVLEKLRSLVVELVAPEWGSEQERRRRLVEGLEKRIAAVEGRLRQRQNEETAQRQAQNVESLARQIIDVYRSRDARRLASLVDPWNALLRFGLRPADGQTQRGVDEALAWLEAEQSRLHTEQEAEARRSFHASRVADWEATVARFSDALSARASLSALTELRRRARELGAELGRLPPTELEAAFQDRLRRRRVFLWRGSAVAVALSAVLVVAVGTFLLSDHSADQEWQDCVAMIRGASEEFQRQADAFMPDPTAPVPDTERLAKSYSDFQAALDRARRLASSSDREGQIKEVAATHAKASTSLEQRVIAFLGAVDGGLENAQQILNDDDTDNAKGIVEQKSAQLAKLAGLEPLLPAVANRISQLHDKCAGLERRLRAEDAKHSLGPKLDKLSTIYPSAEAATRVREYADVLREFADLAPNDSRAEDFIHAAQEESLWVEAFGRRAFAVGWLQKRGSSTKPWRCETNWRPTPGAKYTLHVMLPASGGASARLAKIGEMDGTRPVLDASLPQETWLQGRLVFALKSDG